MIKTTKALTTTEYSWKDRALKAEAELEVVTREKQRLESQLLLMRAKRFGASSEKTNKEQLALFDDVFNEAEAAAEPFAPEPELITVPEHKRAKAKRNKVIDLAGLPEEIEEHHLPEEQMVCASCGEHLHVIRQETTKELVHVPERFYVKVIVRDVCGCRSCEKNGAGETSHIVMASAPNRPFPGSIASSSVVANIIEEKFVMGSPLYRQEQQWIRRGVPLSRQNMSNWILHAARTWFEPVYERMKAELLKQNIIQADETTVQVLQEDGKKAESKSFMWLYRSNRHGPGIVLYEYQPSRAGEHPRRFLDGFRGYLQTDGYAGYHGISDVINVGCWAHAKRGFTDAIQASGGRDKSPKTLEGLAFCNKLYKIEHELGQTGPEERYEKRLLLSKPILESFLAWLLQTKEETLPQTYLSKAIQYCLNQWKALSAFLLDGRLEIDNNRSERSIKPFVIARKNFLFCVTPQGARASAVTFSVVESAKENGLKPYEYLKYLLDELPNATTGDLDKYMPWSLSLPDYCRTAAKK